MTNDELQPLLKEAFRESLIAHIKTYRANIAEMSRVTGVPKTLIYALTQRKTSVPGVDVAIPLARYFGKSVEEFVGFSPDDREDRIRAMVGRLSPSDQEFLETQLQALIASRR